MNKWKILETEDVSPSSWYPISRHTVELPDGTVIDDFYISEIGDVVLVVPFTTDGMLVLVRQYKHAVREIVFELPAGGKQKDKTIEESAVAELEEETGIRTAAHNLEFIGKLSSDPTKTTHVTHCYIARDVSFNSQQNFDVTEDIEVHTVSPLKAVDMVKSGEIWVADSAAAILKTQLMYPKLFAH